MAYSLYMGDVLLPVTPPSMEIKIKGQNKTLNLINDGEINMLKQAGLTEVTFEALLPNKKYPFAVYHGGFRDAKYYLDVLELLKTSQKPFKFRLIRDGGHDTSFDMALEEYVIKEDAENGTDFVVAISLKQYKAYGTKMLNFNPATNKVTEKTTSKRIFLSTNAEQQKKEITYRIRPGDSLWSIARTQLGDGHKQYDIYNLNKITLDREARKHGKTNVPGLVHVFPGTVIKIRK